MPEVVAVVHAKGSSERVLGKNLRMLGDRPLFCWAIRNALSSSLIDIVYVDSEADQILRIGSDHGARPLHRPRYLADNRITGDQLAVWQAESFSGAQIIAQVVPTSPFIAPETITRAVKMLVDQQLDSVVGVRIERRYAWRNGQPAYLRADGSIPNSGDLAAEIRETTGLYVNTRAAVLENRRRISPRCAPIALSALEAIDIDYEEDFALAELVATGLAARSLEGSTDAVHAGCYRR